MSLSDDLTVVLTVDITLDLTVGLTQDLTLDLTVNLTVDLTLNLIDVGCWLSMLVAGDPIKYYNFKVNYYKAENHTVGTAPSSLK